MQISKLRETMKKNKRILIIASHPDDEVLGCFGTVAKLIQKGYEAYTLILSGGKASRASDDDIILNTEKENLKKEMLLANNVIGIQDIFHFDFPDNAFDSVPLLEIIKIIEKIKKEIQPSIVFTHHVGDMNIDHQITHKATLTATRPIVGESVKSVYAMEIPSSTEYNAYSPQTVFIPNVFFDISTTIDLKIEAMSKYVSELKDASHPRSLEYIRALAQVNGVKTGMLYCENFMLVRGLYE